LQIELKAGKGALQREREEQQHLLAESYSAVMELTRQLQVSERNWSQEKLQLLERLQGEKQRVEQQVKDLQNRLSQVSPAPACACLTTGKMSRSSVSCRYSWIRELRDCSQNEVFLSQSLQPVFFCISFNL
jgi:hypothetical protein